MNRTPILFLHVLIIATCGLIYELIAGTLASYVLGDSVTQFSLIIGIYLFALGVGAWLSRFIETNLARYFIEVELGVAILGGVSAPLLFLSFANLNAVVGLWGTWVLRPLIKGSMPALRGRAVIVIALLVVGVIKADRLTSMAEDGLFADDIIYARSSPYQRLVITRGRAGFQLFLNGNLQFSSTDEYRYHEALVHPALMLANAPRRVLVLGGGDGLALREILKHPSVESVTLVDLDPDMTKLSQRFPPLAG